MDTHVKRVSLTSSSYVDTHVKHVSYVDTHVKHVSYVDTHVNVPYVDTHVKEFLTWTPMLSVWIAT